MITTVEEEATAQEPVEGQMQFQSKKFVLQVLLDKCVGVVPSKDFVPVLKNFRIEVKDNKIRVAATDMTLAVVAESQFVNIEQPGSAVFDAQRLMQIIKEAEDGDLYLTVADGEGTIRVGRTTWTLKLQDGSDYPDLPEAGEIEFVPVDRGKFIAGLNAVRYAVSQETVRPSLMLVDVSNGKMRAADGVRFQQISMDGVPDVQIPGNAVDDLLKILRTSEEQNVGIGQDDDSLMFKLGEDVFVAQKLVVEFPDVDSQLLKPALANDEELIVDRAELLSAIKRIRITADPETSAVVLRLSNDTVTVESKDKYGSHSEESIDAKWSSPERVAAFNHHHLIEMLTMSDAKTCHFFFGKDMKTRPSVMLLRDDEAQSMGVLSQVRADFIS